MKRGQVSCELAQVAALAPLKSLLFSQCLYGSPQMRANGRQSESVTGATVIRTPTLRLYSESGYCTERNHRLCPLSVLSITVKHECAQESVTDELIRQTRKQIVKSETRSKQALLQGELSRESQVPFSCSMSKIVKIKKKPSLRRKEKEDEESLLFQDRK